MITMYKRTYWPSAQKENKSTEILTVQTTSKLLSKLLHIWYYHIKRYGWVKE